jgi:hypothetical protein
MPEKHKRAEEPPVKFVNHIQISNVLLSAICNMRERRIKIRRRHEIPPPQPGHANISPHDSQQWTWMTLLSLDGTTTLLAVSARVA